MAQTRLELNLVYCVFFLRYNIVQIPKSFANIVYHNCKRDSAAFFLSSRLITADEKLPFISPF